MCRLVCILLKLYFNFTDYSHSDPSEVAAQHLLATDPGVVGFSDIDCPRISHLHDTSCYTGCNGASDTVIVYSV